MTRESSPQEQEARRQREEKNRQLDEIIQPLASPKYTVDVSFSYLEHHLEGFAKDWGLNLSPDFQRGHVWTQEQRISYIEGIFRGTVNDSQLVIQFNAPHWVDDNPGGDLPLEIQIVDGLQRLTAVRQFLMGNVLPFGLTAESLQGSKYDVRRSLFRLKFAMHNFSWRKDLLKYYLDLNTGGTPHGQEEIQRVKSLLLETSCASNHDLSPSFNARRETP